jgi:hypothetical protein
MAITVRVRKGTPYFLDANDNPTFEGWMGRVDHLLRRAIGLSADDLPDCPWRDWYEERVRPIRAANKALKAAGADLF